MAHITADRVKDTTSTTGTGAVTLSGTAPTGYRTFSAVCSVADTVWYCIAHQTLGEWEIGLGTYSALNTLTRTTVIASSNSGAAVTFSAGTKDVFISAIASKLAPPVDVQTFNASGTWTKPTGYAANSRVLIECWGAGGSGCKNATAGGGGGGGGYNERWALLSELGATETVTVGAGGTAISVAANGNTGGNTTFGSLCAAYGGAGGVASAGGGGGGQLSAGTQTTMTFSGTSNTTGGQPGQPLVAGAVWGTDASALAGGPEAMFCIPQGIGGGTGGNYVTARHSFWHGGGGASTSTTIGSAGNSVKGGGGGGASANNTSGGTSSHGGAGGAGGATGTAGTAPGGGGGGSTSGNSGAGAAGRVIVTVFPN